MRRYVFDPGVLIAAATSPRGAPADLMLEWLDGGFELIACPHLLDELARVLGRSKFRRYLTVQQAEAFVRLIGHLAIVVTDPDEVEPVTPDPGDDYLVALARKTKADGLVSGDKHLANVDVVQILSPGELHAAIKRRGSV